MKRPTDMGRGSQWCVAITGMNAKPDNPGPGCAVARCLRESGGFHGRIVGLGYETLDPGLYQRETCDTGYLMPYPAVGAAALLERLDEVLRVEPIDALIPCLDAELPNFIAIESELRQRGVRLMLPVRDQLRRRDKDRLPALCAAAGVATPEVRRLTSADFFDTCENEGWTYPLVVKGVFYDAYIVYSAAEAKVRFQQMVAAWGYPILAQKFVGGEEVNLTALGDGTGAMVGEVMMKKQALTDKGKAWAGVAINDPELREAGRTLMATLQWRGPLELEMLRDTSGTLHLIDEVLTPDSSRFWPADTYQIGTSPASFDKQIVRDYLETLKDWNKQSPGPHLPAAIIEKTTAKYREALARLTGA